MANSALRRLIFEVSRSHTIRHTHAVRLLLTSDQLVAGAATYTTHSNTTHKYPCHSIRGFRTRHPSNQASADVRLGLRGQRTV